MPTSLSWPPVRLWLQHTPSVSAWISGGVGLEPLQGKEVKSIQNNKILIWLGSITDESTLSAGTSVSPATFSHLTGRYVQLSWPAFPWLMATLRIVCCQILMKYVTLTACQEEHFVLLQTLCWQQLWSHVVYLVSWFHRLTLTHKMKKMWAVVMMWRKGSRMASVKAAMKENGATHGNRVWVFAEWTVSLGLLNNVSVRGYAPALSSRPRWPRRPVSTTILPLLFHLRNSNRCLMVLDWWQEDQNMPHLQ